MYTTVHNFDLELNGGGGLIWKFYCNLKNTGGLSPPPQPDSNFAHVSEYNLIWAYLSNNVSKQTNNYQLLYLKIVNKLDVINTNVYIGTLIRIFH